jgi:hypothetical protein
MSKIINHILLLTIGCTIFLWIHCFNPSPEAEKVSMGYNIAFISFLLLVQSIFIWIVFNNVNNRFGFGSATCCIPNEFMVGICLGLCIGGTVIAFIMSRSFHTASQQCTAFDSLKKPVTRFLVDTIVSNTTNTTTTNTAPVPAPAPAPHTTSNTNTSPTTSFEHDPILQYICSKVFQRILRSRMFWSTWIFRFNLINIFLIAVARPELTNETQSQHHQSYMGVSTVDDGANSNTGGSSRTRIGSQQPYNNPSGGSVFAATVARMPAFVGDYATIPEVRTPSVTPVTTTTTTTTTNGNGNYSTSSSSLNNKSSETANILSV